MMEPAFRPRHAEYKSGFDNSGPETQRPPVYNAEDYAGYLGKYCKLTGLQLYLQPGQAQGGDNSVKTNKNKLLGKSRPEKHDSSLFDKHQMEMGLKQFTSISELLNKLKIDLHLSYHSFLKEFISEPNDGVTLLLDLLKVIQLSQTNISGVNSNPGNNSGGANIPVNQSVFKKALADEHECLLCLKLCAESEEGGMRLVEHPSGLFTIAVCVMSNFSKSRVLALQLLTKMATITTGHKQVSDAVSMLRLRFGEPVRFKFLIGMLNSYSSGAFQISCLRFLNTFVETATNFRERVYIQAELEDAGFDISHLKKLVSKFGNQSDLLKEELNIWTKNYIDVNSLVTEKFMMQKALDKAKTDFESLTKKYQDLDVRHKKMLTEYNAAKAKCDSYEEFGGGRWVEGGNSDQGSDQDSGKHSDTSLVNSSEECWAEINKINKNYNKRQTSSAKSGHDPGPLLLAAPDSSSDSNRSKYPGPGAKSGHNHRNVISQGQAAAPGSPLTPGDPGETGGAVNIVITESGESNVSSLGTKDDCDHDTYVERDTLQEEAVMVETQTIKINQDETPRSVKKFPGDEGGKKLGLESPASGAARHSVTRVMADPRSELRSELRDLTMTSSSYDDMPLPPSPRPVSKYRNRDKASRGGAGEVRSGAVAVLTDEDSPSELLKRQPRPPIRRRPRSKMQIAERPKSAPPEKYESRMFQNDKGRPSHFSQSRDFSDEEETSETYLSRGSYDPGESHLGTLETVSAKSFGFIRPSQRLLEREQNKRIKRHKSFFNTDSLFGKKNSLIRRAESFHHGGSRAGAAEGGHNDYYLMSGKYYSKDAKERAKSVDRLLSAGDIAGPGHHPLDKPLMKSKSMEFLKSKILRKPSKLQKKSGTRVENSGPVSNAGTFLGQSMFELHKTPHYSPAPAPARPRSRTRGFPDWHPANSSGLPSSEFSKQDVRHTQSQPKLCETTQKYPQQPPPTFYNSRHVGSQNYDWRQDTPFWNYSRQKRKENVLNWGLADTGPPPTWVPPPPVPGPGVASGRKTRESLSPGPYSGSPSQILLPGPVLHQAVNCMYLPGPGSVSPAQLYPHSQDSMGDSFLEITELEDEPLSGGRARTDNLIEHPQASRILEMTSGLY